MAEKADTTNATTPTGSNAPATPPRPNPYVGPRSFMRGEKLYGREREARRLVNLLIAERIVLLYSPSGAGKTSLIHAALFPELEEEEFHVLPVLRVSLADPSLHASADPNFNRYTLSLMMAMEETIPAAEQMAAEQMQTMRLPDYLAYLTERMQVHQPSATHRYSSNDDDEDTTDDLSYALDRPLRWVLIVDQFEEILTLNPADHEAKTAFFQQIGEVLQDRQCWALFSIREDFVAALEPYLSHIPTRLDTTFRLDMLHADAAHKAIQQPAAQAGVDFTDAAVTKLIDDLRQVKIPGIGGHEQGTTLGQHVEPVQLQVVCYRLWEKLPPNQQRIEEADLDIIGTVDHALADYYADRVVTIAKKTGISERAMRDWFDQHLITEQGFRGQIIQGSGASEGLDNDAISMLIDAHLVRAEKRRGIVWYELAHDRMIEPVRQSNAAWRQAHLSMLQEQAALWLSHNRPDNLLLRDQMLKDAELWARNNRGDVTSEEWNYLHLSRNAQQRFERGQRKNRLISILAAIATVSTVVAVVLFIFQFQRAETALRRALVAFSAQRESQGQQKAILDTQGEIRQQWEMGDESLQAYHAKMETAVSAQQTVIAIDNDQSRQSKTQQALAETSLREAEVLRSTVITARETEAALWATQETVAAIQYTQLVDVIPYPIQPTPTGATETEEAYPEPTNTPLPKPTPTRTKRPTRPPTPTSTAYPVPQPTTATGRGTVYPLPSTPVHMPDVIGVPPEQAEDTIRQTVTTTGVEPTVIIVTRESATTTRDPYPNMATPDVVQESYPPPAATIASGTDVYTLYVDSD